MNHRKTLLIASFLIVLSLLLLCVYQIKNPATTREKRNENKNLTNTSNVKLNKQEKLQVEKKGFIYGSEEYEKEKEEHPKEVDRVDILGEKSAFIKLTIDIVNLHCPTTQGVGNGYFTLQGTVCNEGDAPTLGPIVLNATSLYSQNFQITSVIYHVTGWDCAFGCTRNDTILPGECYPDLLVDFQFACLGPICIFNETLIGIDVFYFDATSNDCKNVTEKIPFFDIECNVTNPNPLIFEIDPILNDCPVCINKNTTLNFNLIACNNGSANLTGYLIFQKYIDSKVNVSFEDVQELDPFPFICDNTQCVSVDQVTIPPMSCLPSLNISVVYQCSDVNCTLELFLGIALQVIGSPFNYTISSATSTFGFNCTNIPVVCPPPPPPECLFCSNFSSGAVSTPNFGEFFATVNLYAFDEHCIVYDTSNPSNVFAQFDVVSNTITNMTCGSGGFSIGTGCLSMTNPNVVSVSMQCCAFDDFANGTTTVNIGGDVEITTNSLCVSTLPPPTTLPSTTEPTIAPTIAPLLPPPICSGCSNFSSGVVNGTNFGEFNASITLYAFVEHCILYDTSNPINIFAEFDVSSNTITNMNCTTGSSSGTGCTGMTNPDIVNVGLICCTFTGDNTEIVDITGDVLITTSVFCIPAHRK